MTAAFQNQTAYMALYAVILLPLVSLAATIIASRGLRASIWFEKDIAVKFEDVQCLLEVQNKSPLAITGVKIFYEDSSGYFTDEVYMDLPPMGKEQDEFTMFFSYRGLYTVKLSCIEYWDWLGIFCLRKKIKDAAQIRIYPRIIEPEDSGLVQALVAQTQAQAKFPDEDYTNISDVRKYADTDSYKKIHWKLSAKRGELMVKNYQTSTGSRVCFLMDINNATADINDAIAEEALSLVDKLLRMGMQTELSFGEDFLIKLPANDHKDFHEIYRQVAELEFGKGIDLSAALLNYTKEQDGFCTVAILTHRLSDSLCEAVLDAKAGGFGIVLMYFSRNRVYRRDAAILEGLKNLGIDVKTKIIGL